MKTLTLLVRKESTTVSAIDEPAVKEMKAAMNRAGYDASESDIEWAWEQHSEDWSASWLVLGSCGGADGAVKYLLEYLVEKS